MRLIAFLACACSAIATTSCIVDAEAEPMPAAPSEGTLTVAWTINGSADPDQCNQSSADTIRITVEPGGTFEESCAAFSAGVALEPGTYAASAVLLDANGNARTTSVEIDPFTVGGGDDVTAPIDFPASSFY